MMELSKLRWRCRRGIKEMDVLFEQYLERYYTALDDTQKNHFEAFLEEADLDILDWITKRKPLDNADYQLILQQLQTLNSNHA